MPPLTKAIGKKISPLEGNQAPSRNSDDQDQDPPNLNPPTRVRRRPIFLAIGVALVVVAMIGMVTAVNAMRSTTELLVLSNEVEQGHPIESEDLTVKEVNSDSGIGGIPASDRARIIGMRPVSGMPAGTVLLPSAVTDEVVPGEGLTLVGITVAYHQRPSVPVVAGDMIRIVDTPRAQDNAPVAGPINSKAQVYSITEIPETLETTFNVLVPKAEANWVAARAATKRISIVLDSRER